MVKFFSIIFVSLLFIQCNEAKNQSSEATILLAKESKIDSSKKIEIAASLNSEITCPKCGHKKVEKLPTDKCLLKYNCENCKTELFPKEGDCCVFCTYGDHKCPSKQ